VKAVQAHLKETTAAAAAVAVAVSQCCAFLLISACLP